MPLVFWNHVVGSLHTGIMADSKVCGAPKLPPTGQNERGCLHGPRWDSKQTLLNELFQSDFFFPPDKEWSLQLATTTSAFDLGSNTF